MERVATLLWPLLGLTCLLFLQLPGTQATGRRLSYPDPLPSCSQVPGGIPGWDCYDPPNHPLPPCDFHHQRIGFDCSGWPPVSHASTASPTTFKSKTRSLLERHIAIDLPPCSETSDGSNSWKCLGARTWPPAVGNDAGEASATTVKSETTQEKGGHVEAELPPCNQVPGGIPGWDCYDPPNHSLPPCDFHHQRIGFDCSGWPPVSHASAASPATFKSKTRPLLERHIAIDLPPCSQTSDGSNSWKCYDARTWPPAVGNGAGESQTSPATMKSETQEKGGHVEAELPPCNQVPGGIPGRDCYDKPNHPLPPCNLRRHRIGIDCGIYPPAVGSDAGEASPVTVKRETTQEKGGHVEVALPPCSEVPGGIPGWQCYDPPN